jgi:hypothetical protein
VQVGKVALDLRALVKSKLEIGRMAAEAHAPDTLVVDVDCWPVHVGGRTVGYAVHFALSVWRPATVEGSRAPVNASTWESKESGLCPDLAGCIGLMKETVGGLMDELLADLVKANP